MNDTANLQQLTAEDRLVEWAKSRFKEPWNYWPSAGPLGRMKDDGPGASQGTAEDPDGGLGALIDRLTRDGFDGVGKDRRCAEMQEVYARMPTKFVLLVDATYRNCPSARDCPRSWSAAIAASGLSESTYVRRKKLMLKWLEYKLDIPASPGKPARSGAKIAA